MSYGLRSTRGGSWEAVGAAMRRLPAGRRCRQGEPTPPSNPYMAPPLLIQVEAGQSGASDVDGLAADSNEPMT